MDHRLTRLIAVASSSVLVLTILAAAPAAVRAGETAYIGDGTGSGECDTPDYLTNGSADDVEFNTAVAEEDEDIDNILYVCPGTYDITGDIDVEGALTIESVAGAAATVLDSDGTSRVFTLNGDVIVRGLTFKDGGSNSGSVRGGAISTNSDLTVEDSVFLNNKASDEGGAVYVGTDELIIRRSTFTGNSADSSGGAVYANGNIDLILDSVFVDNEAGYDGGAVHTYLYFDDDNEDGQSGVIGSSFSGNTAGDDGGAVYIDRDLREEAVISENEFTNNEAGDEGGAVHVGSDAYGPIHNNVFTGNTAEYGGAVWVDDEWYTVSGNKFTRNAALYGGAMNLRDTQAESILTRNQFRSNTATYQGGALVLDDHEGDSESQLALISGNSFRGNRAGGDGGGIYLEFGFTVAPENLTRNSFRSNRAGVGGAIALYSCETGEVSNRQAARAFKKNKFASNRATESRRTKNVGSIHGCGDL